MNESEKLKAQKEKQESIEEQIARNPCDKCRRKGYIYCAGHGGGGGGGEEEEEKEATDELTAELGLNLLHILNDLGRGILTIRPKLGIDLEDERQINDYINRIKLEFDAFKLSLGAKGNELTAVMETNGLVIRIPSPKYYDAFINQLLQKNLLNKDRPSPTPFSTRPTPVVSKKEDDKKISGDQSKQQVQNPFSPTPFKTTLDLEPSKTKT